MASALQYRHFIKVKWAQASNARHVHTVLARDGAPGVKGIDATNRAKVVLRLSSIELVERQLVRALRDMYIVQVGRYGHGAAHAAVRAVAPAHAAQPIGQNHTKADGTTMASRLKFAPFVKVRGVQNCIPFRRVFSKSSSQFCMAFWRLPRPPAGLCWTPDCPLLAASVSTNQPRKADVRRKDLAGHSQVTAFPKGTRSRLAERGDKIEVFYLPSYSPEINPEEQLKAGLKQVMDKRVPVRTKAKLRDAANEHMAMLEKSPERVISFFQDPKVLLSKFRGER